MILTGDCLEVMPTLEAESVDAVVTDPPYLLRFMGKTWDSPTQMSGHATPDADTVGFYQAIGKGGRHDGGHDNWRPNLMAEWHHAWAREAFRLAKPSAYLLAFGGTRTVHRMACAIEDAGWLIRDMLVWAYASGFPKSKASLKPAWEPIVMARKPGPLRELAIDACRIPTDDALGGGAETRVAVEGKHEGWRRPWMDDPEAVGAHTERVRANVATAEALGRWPANVILTDPIFDGGWDGVVGGGETSIAPPYRITEDHVSRAAFPVTGNGPTYGDSGTYSRFFLIPKADRAEREPIWEAAQGLPEGEHRTMGDFATYDHGLRRRNVHPTVKPPRAHAPPRTPRHAIDCH